MVAGLRGLMLVVVVAAGLRDEESNCEQSTVRHA